MDKWLHPLWSLGCDYFSIPKLQRCSRRNLEMDLQFHFTLYWTCDYVSMMGIKLILVRKKGSLPTHVERLYNCISIIPIIGQGCHWGRVTHICVSKLTIIGSDNGLSPGRRQAVIWTNAGILLIGPLGTNFSEISIEILTFSFNKMRIKVSSAKWRPFCIGLNVLMHHNICAHC